MLDYWFIFLEIWINFKFYLNINNEGGFIYEFNNSFLLKLKSYMINILFYILWNEIDVGLVFFYKVYVYFEIRYFEKFV